MAAANGLFLFVGAMLPPPNERPQFLDQAFERSERDNGDTIAPGQFGQAVRRQMARRDMAADPPRDGGPREGPRRQGNRWRSAWAAQRAPENPPPAHQDQELRMRRALERAMAQTLRRHRAELDQMFREAVAQALREIGPAPVSSADRPEMFERYIRPGPWQRGRDFDGPGGRMLWHRWHDRWSEGRDGCPGICPFCGQRCDRWPGDGMRWRDGSCWPGKCCRPPADGPGRGKWRDDRGPGAGRGMWRGDKDRGESVAPRESRDGPEPPRKLERNRDRQLDRKARTDPPRERWGQDERHDDPPDDDD